MSGYGFTKKSQTEKPVAKPARSLDLDGIEDIPPVQVSPEKEQAAINAGEKLGFRDRQPSVPSAAANQPLRRSIAKIPQGKLLVTGPAEVLERFKQYSHQQGHRAYWETLAKLMQ